MMNCGRRVSSWGMMSESGDTRREKKEAAGGGKTSSLDVSASADMMMLSGGVYERKESVPMSRRLRAKS